MCVSTDFLWYTWTLYTVKINNTGGTIIHCFLSRNIGDTPSLPSNSRTKSSLVILITTQFQRCISHTGWLTQETTHVTYDGVDDSWLLLPEAMDCKEEVYNSLHLQLLKNVAQDTECACSAGGDTGEGVRVGRVRV